MKESIFILLIILSISVFAEMTYAVSDLNKNIISSVDSSINYKNFSDTSKYVIDEKGDTIYLKKRKFTAILLTILTGPLGGHRLYLGTKPIVPVVYAVTLGGGLLVIPIIDLFTIIFTKDLSKYEENDKVLMWINGEEDDDFDE